MGVDIPTVETPTERLRRADAPIPSTVGDICYHAIASLCARPSRQEGVNLARDRLAEASRG
eukprot:3418225-Pyramimonas_sp.AAC.1